MVKAPKGNRRYPDRFRDFRNTTDSQGPISIQPLRIWISESRTTTNILQFLANFTDDQNSYGSCEVFYKLFHGLIDEEIHKCKAGLRNNRETS